MAGRRLTITVDQPLLDALHGEGARTCEPASRVVERVLRAALPDYVARELRHDLRRSIPARVVDVTTSPDAATPPELTDGATSESSHDHAELSLPPARPEPVAGDAGS